MLKTNAIAGLGTTLLIISMGVHAFPSTGVAPLRVKAAEKGLLIGSGAINPLYLDDPEFSAVLANQFNSLSSENELKWSFIHPTEGYYNWSSIDRLVKFAEDHDMAVKGHGLISSCCNPEYLLKIIDPTAFRAAMTTHFETIMHRYHGKMDRWDVVTEALETMGGGLQVNDFHKVLGPGYIAEVFRIARAADPTAKLFINENLVESQPGKRQELYDLVSGLVKDGVPLDGVALQMHIVEGLPVPAGVITDMVKSYNALGLEVSIAEMDVSTLNTSFQTDVYSAVTKEALSVGITEIRFWGFTDKHGYAYIPGAQPLLFSSNYTAKGAFYAVQSNIRDWLGDC